VFLIIIKIIFDWDKLVHEETHPSRNGRMVEHVSPRKTLRKLPNLFQIFTVTIDVTPKVNEYKCS
jgi:hypothetical protein